MKLFRNFIILHSNMFASSCNRIDSNEIIKINPFVNVKYLAFCGSDTILQHVCKTCRFPTHLKGSLQKKISK